MSYCRWSTNNFQCDVYCYESSMGFETHIAGFRARIWVRIFRWTTDRRIKISNKHSIRSSRFSLFWLPHWITHKRIGLSSDGLSFTDRTKEEMFERVTNLKKEGYLVPDYMLNFPLKEIAPE